LFFTIQLFSKDRDKTVIITPQPGSLLSIIAEEDTEQQQFGVTYSSTSMCNKTTQLQKTFNIQEKTLSEENMKKTFTTAPSIMLSAAKKPISESMQELRFERTGNGGDVGKSKYLKLNQGSMPNLSENVARELNSIENNRYFYQDGRGELSANSPNSSAISTISTISTLSHFHENDIKAESSRFNLNDMDRLSTATTIFEFFGHSQTSSRETSPSGKGKLQGYSRNSLQVPATGGAKRTREPDTNSPSIHRKNKINKTSTLTISPPSRNKILMDFAEKGKDAQKQLGEYLFIVDHPKFLSKHAMIIFFSSECQLNKIMNKYNFHKYIVFHSKTLFQVVVNKFAPPIGVLNNRKN
jgi:hypothetical protein